MKHMVQNGLHYGAARLKRLIHGETHIHHRPKEAVLCINFCEVFRMYQNRLLLYGGKSLAGCCAKEFNELRKPGERQMKSREIFSRMLARQKYRCTLLCVRDLRD